MNQECDNRNFISMGIPNPHSVEVSHNRLFVVMILFTVAFLVISLRVFDVSLLSGETLTASDQEIDAPSERLQRRADVLDRNGVILATSLVTASLYANPKVML